MVSLARTNILLWLLSASLTASHCIPSSVTTIQQHLSSFMYLNMLTSQCIRALVYDIPLT